MKIDLSCPIEVRGYTLTAPESGPVASVRLYNLTSRRIASCEAAVCWHCSESGRRIVCPVDIDRLHAAGRSFFRLELENRRLPGADSLELLFSAVRFEDDGPDWRAGDGPYAEIQPPPPIGAESLAALKRFAGEDAVRYPCQDSRVWTCVCGRTNANNQEHCVRCHREHFSILRCTEEHVRAQGTACNDATISEPAFAVMHARYLRRRFHLFAATLLMTLAALMLTAFWLLQDAPESAPAPDSPAILAVRTSE